MKKLLLTISVILGVLHLCIAQDLITKITGEDIQAKVLEVNQGEIKYKRFSNLDGPVFTLSKADILMIRYENGTKDIFSVQPTRQATQRTVQKTSTNSLSLNRGTGLKSGYTSNVEIGYCFGAGDYPYSRFKLNVVGNYQINPHFSLGAGSGLRAYSDIETLLMPIFTQIRGYIFDNNISPYGSVDIGYSVSLTGDGIDGGFYFSPSLGAIFNVANNLWFSCGLGYEMQKITEQWRYGTNIYEDDYKLGAITLNVGLVF
ncbi:hypothetical protein [Maribellus maritimus]|uniref:hypothetical protein n=1 Tax=Maribellus maritimus TaxID=2870838 RepID=UPI001EEA7523|nr:hypothetical protein [Maribellus maritimus]MCG6187691.1 hypothetical protein [Maribellus maritimus]